MGCFLYSFGAPSAFFFCFYTIRKSRFATFANYSALKIFLFPAAALWASPVTLGKEPIQVLASRFSKSLESAVDRDQFTLPYRTHEFSIWRSTRRPFVMIMFLILTLIFTRYWTIFPKHYSEELNNVFSSTVGRERSKTLFTRCGRERKVECRLIYENQFLHVVLGVSLLWVSRVVF